MTDQQLARFRTNLATIADCYALLAAQHHAAVTGTSNVRVGGSTEPRLPIAVDHVDLTSDARHGSLDIADSSPWPEDQIGHLAVASELDFWVRDIADQCGERLPMPTAPVLAMWLHERAGWAWDYYGALDEMVVTVDRLARTLNGIVNPRGPRPERKTAPCPGCGEALLLGDGERVWCDDQTCGRVLTEAEYGDWSRMTIARLAGDSWGISAKEISLRTGKPMGTVHSWASRYGWAKTGPERRPVLYSKAQVETTLAMLEDAHETEQAA